MNVDAPLSQSNFLQYAAAMYDNPSCHSTHEFLEDVKRFKYIKKLVTRYQTTGVLKERLILNHVIILCNVFGPRALTRMLFLRMGGQMLYLKPFLVLMEILPEEVYDIEGVNIITDDVPLDPGVVSALRRIRDNGNGQTIPGDVPGGRSREQHGVGRDSDLQPD